METDIIVKELDDGNGGTTFGWRFVIDNETYADGYEATYADAMRKARMAREEWEDRNREEE